MPAKKPVRKIKYYGGQWCVLSADGAWVLSRHPTHEAARTWKGDRNLSRHVHLMAATGDIRTATYDDREHIVVPVVALVEGVLFAVNADSPELVLAEEFGKVPEGWNGRPVMLDHPSYGDDRISANDPRVLEATGMGQVFHARVDGKRLLMEAWIDPARAEKVGGASLVASMRKGEMAEVSVGVFVRTETRSGEYDGRPYSAVWREIVPDHLAVLPEGKIGACSNAMGCGTPRAARARVYLATAAGWQIAPGFNDAIDLDLPKEETPMKWRDALRALVGKPAPPTQEELVALRASLDRALEGMSDTDLRGKLDAALREVEPGYMWVDLVYPDEGLVIYCCSPKQTWESWRRGFSVAADGAVSLSADREAVVQKTEYVPAVPGENTTMPMMDYSANPAERHAAGGCGCSKTPPALETNMVDKKQRVAALIAGGKTPFKAASAPALEQLPEEELKALEDAAAAQPVAAAPVVAAPVSVPAPAVSAAPVVPPAPALTPEEERETFLKKFPDIKAVLDESASRAAARKVDVLARIKAAGQKSFTEAELAAMPTEQLEKIASIITPPKPRAVDFTAAGGRSADSDTDVIAAPPDMNAAIRTADEKRRQLK